MQKSLIIISGSDQIANQTLAEGLKRSFDIIVNQNIKDLEKIVKINQAGLIILDIYNLMEIDIQIIKRLNIIYPDIKIILVNGINNQKVVAKALAMGAKDVFHRPFKKALLIERVQALMKMASMS